MVKKATILVRLQDHGNEVEECWRILFGELPIWKEVDMIVAGFIVFDTETKALSSLICPPKDTTAAQLSTLEYVVGIALDGVQPGKLEPQDLVLNAWLMVEGDLQ